MDTQDRMKIYMAERIGCEDMDSRMRAQFALGLSVKPEMQKLFSEYEFKLIIDAVAKAIDDAVAIAKEPSKEST